MCQGPKTSGSGASGRGWSLREGGGGGGGGGLLCPRRQQALAAARRRVRLAPPRSAPRPVGHHRCVGSGCCNETPHTVWLQQRNLLSRSFRGWKSKIGVSAHWFLLSPPPLACGRLPHGRGLTRSFLYAPTSWCLLLCPDFSSHRDTSLDQHPP